jgi:hypothetical protein
MTNPPPHTPLTEEEAKSGNDLLVMMGNVLACWQGIEHTLADIYLTFFRPARADAAAVTLYAVRTFEARLTVVKALIEHFCSAEQKAKWKRLHEKIRKQSGARNAVAHGLVMRHGKPPNREHVIGRTPYDIAKFPDPPLKNRFYTVKELQEMCGSFLRLTQALDVFRETLANDLALPSKLDSPNQQVLQHETAYPLRAMIPPISKPPPRSSQG